MSWTEILGHSQIEERFRQAGRRNRLASTFLFVGKEGIGKRMFARQLAKALLCERFSEGELESCDQCFQCLQVDARSHPDLIEIAKPPLKNSLPLELFIGDEDRNAGLCHDISLKPFHGGRKIAIVDDADFLNAEGANALLKILEEPPPGSVLILLGTSEQQQLPTILSRCQIVRFGPLSAEQVETVLSRVPLEEGVENARVARAAGGSVQRALLLKHPDVYEFREKLLQQLATLNPMRGDFQKSVVSFLGDKDSEAAARRERLRFVADLAIEFYSALSMCRSGLEIEYGDSTLQQAVQIAGRQLQTSLTNLAASLERTHELYKQIDAFIAPANMVNSWLADLTRLAQGRRLVPVTL